MNLYRKFLLFKLKFVNKFCRKNNQTNLGDCFIYSKFIYNITGKNNLVVLNNSRIFNSKIVIDGNNNKIYIGDNTYLKCVTLYIKGDNSIVNIGSNCGFQHHSEIIIGGGTKLSIGNDSIFGEYSFISTTDSHKIFINGQESNQPKDVIIGNHCWICRCSSIQKGSILGDNVVVAQRSLVNKKYENNVLLCGCPAEIKKTNISWER